MPESRPGPGSERRPPPVITLLGIRFWDPVRDAPVADGLEVRARPAGAAFSVRTAFRSGSGVYAFQGLPGLAGLEYPEGEETPWDPPAAPRRFTVSVTDRRSRFLPLTFTVPVPLPGPGPFPEALPASLPGDGPPGMYLFSSPARTAAPGVGAVRGRLMRAEGGGRPTPAAHAAVEVELAGRAWHGLADERGCFAVLFPYPPMFALLHGSPPPTPQPALDEQQWPVVLRVRHSPNTQCLPAGARVPDLVSLFRQGPADVWPDEHLPAAPEWHARLQFGRELVARTGTRPVLLIGPAASPP